MRKVLMFVLVIGISAVFATTVVAQAPAEKPAPGKTMKAPASGQKEETGPQSPSEKALDKEKAPKAKKGGQKEETGPQSPREKALDKKKAPKAPKGGQKEEVPAPPSKKY